MFGGNSTDQGGFAQSGYNPNNAGRSQIQFGASTQGAFGYGSQDPFNYPMPGRKDLMSLSTIDFQKDNMKTATRKFATRRFDSTNLNTGDIDGASPKLHGSKQVNKPEFSNTNWDIARSSPAALHIGLNKPETNLNIRDIEGTSPKCVQFTTNRLGHNPLSPVYHLPKVDTRPITPPKYIRNTLDISDIPGARAKKDWHDKAKTKPTNKIDDIPGTKAEFRHQARQNSAGYTSYDYRDVTKPHFVTTRLGGDPQNPTYTIRDEDGNPFKIGEIQGNKPQVLPPQRVRGDVSASLKTQDIMGATASTKNQGVFGEVYQRRDVRVLNNTQDIDGAQAGSLKKGTTTKRNTSPLDPQYQMPGHSELVDATSAYSRPKNDFRASKTGAFSLATTQQATAMETLKKPLDVIPEKSPDLEVNKLFQASRIQDAKQGSIFNNNEPKNVSLAAATGVSILSEKKLKEHDEQMKKAPQKRVILPSASGKTSSVSSVQKFDHFISKAQ